MTTPLLFENNCAPGDVVVQTAMFRDIHTVYPGKYAIHYAGNCRQLLQNNPHVVKTYQSPPAGLGKSLNLHYAPEITASNQGRKDHFIWGYVRAFEKQSGIKLVPQLPYGDIHLTAEERTTSLISGRYWLLFPGGKYDFTCKRWSAHRWQVVVNAINACGLTCVQAGHKAGDHWNPYLDDIVNLTGKTDLRQLVQLIQHAEGVICGVTSGMHIAAALQKPCVVLGGGREAWWWEGYVNTDVQTFGPVASGKLQVPHKYLHTLGLLKCCKTKGCWKNKVERYEKDRRKSYCELPTVDEYGASLPECMKMIEPEHVIAAMLQYYEEGMLPPIGSKPEIILPNGGSMGAFINKKLAEGTMLQPLRELPNDELPKPTPIYDKMMKDFKEAGVTIAKSVHVESTVLDTTDVFDDPIIGGKMTIFALMYGDYHELHKNCLNAILSTTSPKRREIRIGCNEVCDETIAYLSRLVDRGQVNLTYVHQTNEKKYPVMREMFYDKDNPIRTKWIVWFDDDSIACKDPAWYEKLCQTIVGTYSTGVRMVGAEMYHGLSGQQRELAKKRPWYRGKQFQMQNGAAAPNGAGTKFVTGGFWALETDMMRRADIPDPILGHNGGDYWIGAQVHQAGGKLKNWNSSKQFVQTSSVKRRGLHELHPGDTGWVPGGVSDPSRKRA